MSCGGSACPEGPCAETADAPHHRKHSSTGPFSHVPWGRGFCCGVSFEADSRGSATRGKHSKEFAYSMAVRVLEDVCRGVHARLAQHKCQLRTAGCRQCGQSGRAGGGGGGGALIAVNPGMSEMRLKGIKTSSTSYTTVVHTCGGPPRAFDIWF